MIPTFEELLTIWEEKLALNKYTSYWSVLEHGIEKLKKYYHKFDKKDIYILALGMPSQSHDMTY